MDAHLHRWHCRNQSNGNLFSTLKCQKLPEAFLGKAAAAAAVTLALLPIDAGAIGPAGPSWKPRELVFDDVNFADQNGGDRILAFDHHGEPGVVFKRSGALDDVHYARKLPGVGWTAQDVFPNTGANGRGAYASLAYDRHERPAISFRSLDDALFDSALRYSYFDGQDWQHEVADVIPNNDTGTWTSLAFDHAGRPAIAYMEAANSRLRFVYDTNGDMNLELESPETVDGFPFGEEASYISLAFDPLNRPMMSYITQRGELMFAVRESLGWITTTIDTNEIETEIASSLAVDPDTGYPAIAYTGLFLQGSLKYAQWDGNDWVLETIDSAGSTGLQPSLAFDPTDGNPAIAYHNPDGEDLRIAWHDGTEWQTDIVDAAGGPVGISPSIAFREFGTGLKVAAIAYHDDSGNVWYIEDPPLAIPEPTAAWLACTAASVLLRRRKSLRE